MSPEELAETWHRCAERLLLIARAIGEPAEDAVQEAFLRLARQQPAPENKMAWLVRVTRNQLLQWRRSNDRRRQREQKHEHRHTAGGWFDSPDEQLSRSLDGQVVTEALKELSQQQREVIVMHLWGELSFDVIAETIGGSRSSAHRAFRQGILEMQKRFRQPQQLVSSSQNETNE